MTNPKNRYELQQLNIDELVAIAKSKKSRKMPFKAILVDYLVEVLEISEEKALFEALCGQYGLKPTDWNRPFKVRRTTLRITGFNPNKPKNKFNLTNEKGEQKFHCGVRFAVSNLHPGKKGKQISMHDFINNV